MLTRDFKQRRPPDGLVVRQLSETAPRLVRKIGYVPGGVSEKCRTKVAEIVLREDSVLYLSCTKRKTKCAINVDFLFTQNPCIKYNYNKTASRRRPFVFKTYTVTMKPAFL